MDQQPVSGVAWTPQAGNADDAEYDAFLARIQARFERNTEGGARPLFMTGVDKALFEFDWLSGFDDSQRQFHDCSACKNFVRRFGSLAVLSDEGVLTPAFWEEDDAPEQYKPAVRAMVKAVRRAPVVRPFYERDKVWGQPETGVWRHMALRPVAAQLIDRWQPPSQRMAEKVQDYQTVSRALADFSLEHINVAVQLLKTDALYRSEKVLGQAEWLQKLHQARAEAKGASARKNVVWLAVAKAPAGFCHPRSSMIGTLLEDVAAGKSYEDVARAFKAKMHPLQYQRPQAAPSAGAIAQAERLIAEMGLVPSLERRFARVEELQALWRPTPAEEKSAESVFGHLKAKGEREARALVAPAQTMTFEKFRRTVLEGARTIDLLVPARGNFCAYVTAKHADAPLIFQWDNPFSTYVYHGGTMPSWWGLRTGWCAVTALSLAPSMWGGEDKLPHHGKAVLFALEGARESRSENLCLFPETLKSELHGVRAVIEAHSKTRGIEGKEEGSACGLMGAGKSWDVTLRVTGAIGKNVAINIDRWD